MKEHNVWCVQASASTAIKIIDLLYANASIYLNHKYEKATQILNANTALGE